MSMNDQEPSVRICAASDTCGNNSCHSQVLGVPLGTAGTRLSVSCERVDEGLPRLSDVIDYDPSELASDYARGDDIARWVIGLDAPVCNTFTPAPRSNSILLINGRPVVTE